MPKKPTLQTLLAQSGDRPEVEYDPAVEAYTPAVGAGGQYNVAVQEVPESNLERLDKALRQAPTLLGQAHNVARNEAVERVATLSDAEIAEELGADKRTLSIMGYDKAFQTELVKNWFIQNEASINKRFTDLASDPSAYTSDGHFNQAVEQEKQDFFGELEQRFGQNPKRVEAFQVLGNAVLRRLTPGVSAQYVDNKLNATKEFFATSFGDQIKNGADPNDALRVLQNDLKVMNIPPKEIAGLLMDNVVAAATQHMNRGSFNKALNIVQGGRDFEVYKGARLGAGKNLTRLSTLRRQILDASAKGLETNSATNRRLLSEMFRANAQDLMGRFPEGFDELKNDQAARAPLAAFIKQLTAKATDEDIDALLDTVAAVGTPNRGLEFHKAVKALVYAKGSDAERGTWNTVTGTLVDWASEEQKEPVTNYRALVPSEIDALASKAADWFATNRSKGTDDYMTENGFRGAAAPPRVVAAHEKEHAIDWLSGVRGSTTDTDATTKTNGIRISRMLKKAFETKLTKGDAPERPGQMDDALAGDLVKEATIGAILSDFDEALKAKALQIKDDEPKARTKEMEQFIKATVEELVDEQVLIQQAVLNHAQTAGPRLPGDPGDIWRDESGWFSDFGRDQEEEKGSIEYALDYLWFTQNVKEKAGKKDDEYISLVNKNTKKLGDQKEAFEDAGLQKNVKKDMQTARDANDIDTLEFLAIAYGYPSFIPEAAAELRRFSVEGAVANVRLFGSEAELDNKAQEWNGHLTSFAENGVTKRNRVGLQELFSFGIHSTEEKDTFVNAQLRLLNRVTR